VLRRLIPGTLPLCLALLLCALPLRAQSRQSPSLLDPTRGTKNTADIAIYNKAPSLGSPYVTLDSWVYPALERLAGLGYVRMQFLGMRPWTRVECAHLVQEAEDRIDLGGPLPDEANRLRTQLQKEFQAELDALAGGAERAIRLEFVHTKLLGISGAPLNDSYHFGQTIINNDGRPYQEGFNSYDGFSGYATAGRFTAYVRGEYQHAPSSSAYALPLRQFIAIVDNNSLQPPTPVTATNQFRLLDAYVAATVANWDLALGKQSLWWGPGKGGALLFSNNAEPIYMLRASRVAPFTLPWIFHWLGPMKLDLFYGKLSGNQFPPRPMIHGEKISFKPTPNLELGFSRTVELGGVGRPLTIGRIARSYFSITSPKNETAGNDPGKRTGGFDISYRLPYVRDWLTLYADSLSTDDPSPIDAPRRAGISPGIYLSHVPKLPRLDLRVEAVYTDTPSSSHGGHYIYYDSFYRDLYTNKNNIIGSWIGRQGQGVQAWSTYWFSPRNTLQFGYRHAKVASSFIPGGETLNDGSAKLDWWIRHDLSVSAFVQYEKWRALILSPGPQTNWTTSIDVTFWPRSWTW
jgi:hypothetical protein